MTAGRPLVLWIGCAIVACLALVAALAPVLAPYDPRAISGRSFQPPSGAHLLGTNDSGQDILSQLVWGARSSTIIAVCAAGIAVAAGALVGAAAGLARGVLDLVTMRVIDIALALPALPLLIVIVALAGPSRATVVLVIALAGWPAIARVVRSQTLTLGGRGYVQAARGFGARPPYLIRRHLLPAVGPLVAASFVYWAATAVVLQAGLAFLGLSDPTEISWGGLLNRALEHQGVYLTSQWTWWVLPPGLAITLAAIGLAFIGFGLEPRSNPRWERA
ncbi:MAG TPA: ABC transporter permease [Solirubrobacteraceae bacterium]|nr:ABC transporter permease [Solirubrobacteraceae bacterium]